MFSTRRDFLRHASLIALAPSVPGFLAQTARATSPEKNQRILVVIQLDGGNDGINTVIPYADEGYAKHRRSLRLPVAQLIKINDQIGLHPSMGEAGKLLESQRLAIVQGVGYPNPNRSHFESMAIWQTARPDPEERSLGWLGRALDSSQRLNGVPDAVYIGSGTLPLTLRGRRAVASAMTRPQDFVLMPGSERGRLASQAQSKEDLAAFVQRSALDAYATADRMKDVLRAPDSSSGYPSTNLASQLRLVARLVKLDLGTRVFYTRQAGYDTHAAQFGTHFQLLSELAGGLRAFLDDLAAAKLADRVLVLCFSEFGRTVAENASAGTDHGTSGPVFLGGPGIKPGLVGTTPSLVDLDPRFGDLRTSIDFRQVYATILEEWLSLRGEPVLGGVFEKLSLFRS